MFRAATVAVLCATGADAVQTRGSPVPWLGGSPNQAVGVAQPFSLETWDSMETPDGGIMADGATANSFGATDPFGGLDVSKKSWVDEEHSELPWPLGQSLVPGGGAPAVQAFDPAVVAGGLDAQLVSIVPADSMICHQGPMKDIEPLLSRIKQSALQEMYGETQISTGSCWDQGFSSSWGQTCFGNTFGKPEAGADVAEKFANLDEMAKADDTQEMLAEGDMPLQPSLHIDCAGCYGSC
mmetsp:Transcript_84633/g.240057  ORF Transcript_84633/g.240057 Transcript_84633/m.240057 type:complete len:239 (+) Transcript_84633:79-795(+)